MIPVRLKSEGFQLSVHVTPKGSKSELLPFKSGDTTLRLKVNVAPEDGKANAAVIRLLAETLGIAKSRIQIMRGEKSRDKQIAIQSRQSEIQGLLTQLAQSIQSEFETCFEIHS